MHVEMVSFQWLTAAECQEGRSQRDMMCQTLTEYSINRRVNNGPTRPGRLPSSSWIKDMVSTRLEKDRSDSVTLLDMDSYPL